MGGAVFLLATSYPSTRWGIDAMTAKRLHILDNQLLKIRKNWFSEKIGSF
jgi:hypothetical protein